MLARLTAYLRGLARRRADRRGSRRRAAVSPGAGDRGESRARHVRRRGETGGVARPRRSDADAAGRARGPHDVAGFGLVRRAARASLAPAHSGLHGGRAPDARARDRREHRHLLDRQRRAAAAARLPAPRAADVSGRRRIGASQLPVSVAEYLEFQQFNRSFADVGAFRIGEANLMAGDRALRVRSAVVDAHLLNALGVQPRRGVSLPARIASPALRRSRAGARSQRRWR